VVGDSDIQSAEHHARTIFLRGLPEHDAADLPPVLKDRPVRGGHEADSPAREPGDEILHERVERRAERLGTVHLGDEVLPLADHPAPEGRPRI